LIAAASLEFIDLQMTDDEFCS